MLRKNIYVSLSRGRKYLLSRLIGLVKQAPGHRSFIFKPEKSGWLPKELL